MRQSSINRLGIATFALGMAASCADGARELDENESKNPVSAYIVSADMGYDAFPSDYVNVAGSRDADYCRFVGDYPNVFLSCKIWQNGWDGDEYEYNSVDDFDRGHESMPRAFGDVSGDGLADYCRFVGDAPNIFLSCNLAGSGAFEADQYGFNSNPSNGDALDLGYESLGRELRDQNGDGLLDFCRFVGDRDDPSGCCIMANPRTRSFGPNQYECHSGPLSIPVWHDPIPVGRGGGGDGGGSTGGGSSGGGGGGGGTSSSCECTIGGGKCGGAWGHSCDATHLCEPSSACVWNPDQRRSYCVSACAPMDCWTPADVGKCDAKVELPPFDPKNPFPSGG